MDQHDEMRPDYSILVNWAQNKIRLNVKYPILNPDDLDFLPGKEEVLLLHIQGKLGKTRAELAAIIQAL